MQNLNEDDRLRRWVIWSFVAISLGAGVAFYCGQRLLRMAAPWETGDGLWLGLFLGILFIAMGCTALWTWLFARPLTDGERRTRDVMRAWERERSRLTGGDDV